jgi:hypothetical protein
MGEITVKIHNIIHDPIEDKNINELEDSILQYIQGDVKNVRIASGYRNSPMFITLGHSDINFKQIKQICRLAVRHFNRHIGGVNLSKTMRDKNLRIVS